MQLTSSWRLSLFQPFVEIIPSSKTGFLPFFNALRLCRCDFDGVKERLRLVKEIWI